MSLDSNNICTVILAGGRGRRMQGQDKGLIEWQNKPLIEHVLMQLGAHHHCLMISANRNQARYAQYGYDIISDTIDDFQGPLIGILSAFKHTNKDYLLCVPCDSPEPPSQLLERLTQCLSEHQALCAICHDGERLQPLFSLMSRELMPQLESFIQQGKRKVHDFFLQTNPVICDFSDQANHFRNFNQPEDM